MPQSQVASVANYAGAAPVVIGEMAAFKVTSGGKLTFRVENNDDVDATFQVLVSATDSGYVATSVAAHGIDFSTPLAVKARTSRDWSVNLRQGVDLFVQIRGAGGVPLTFQIRGDAKLSFLRQ